MRDYRGQPVKILLYRATQKKIGTKTATIWEQLCLNCQQLLQHIECNVKKLVITYVLCCFGPHFSETRCTQSWNFHFFPEMQNCPSLKKLSCNSFKLMCNFQVHLWFNILTWFGGQKPRSHFCSNFSRGIAVTSLRVATCDAIGDNSRTGCT